MNEKDDLPLPHANAEFAGDDSPDNPERRRVLTGIAAVGLGLALAGCTTEELHACAERVRAFIPCRVRFRVADFARGDGDVLR